MNNPKDPKKDGMSMKPDQAGKSAPKSKTEKSGSATAGKTANKNKQEMSGR